MMFRPDRCLQLPTVDLLSWTFAGTDNFPDRPIYVDAENPDSFLTANGARVLVRQLIAGLQAQGIGPGDHVCVLSYNHAGPPATNEGVGACFVGVNPAYNESELRHIFAIAAAKVIILQPELLDQALLAATSCGISRSAIVLFHGDNKESLSEFQSWRRLLEHGERDWIRFDGEEQARATTATLAPTSGTTGLPKAAKLSHYALVAQNVILYDSAAKPYKVRRLISLPQFHAFAAPLVHTAPLREGHTTWILRRYHREQFLEHIVSFQITETAVVPPIVRDLLAHESAAKDALRHIMYVWCAGAPLSANFQNRTTALLHKEGIFSQVWGMTEVGWITTFHYPERDDSGSVGRLLPNTFARIVDEQGKDVPDKRDFGEILVRGPSLMQCYHANQEATTSSMVNGWLKTGDIGRCVDGKWYIFDRAKEIIKVKGWQVSPAELEQCLMMHPEIRDAAVVGVELHQDEGQVPRAYIVASGEHVRENDIQEYFHGRLAKFKYLAGGVAFVDSIPKSSSGKILRKVLTERAAKEVGYRK